MHKSRLAGFIIDCEATEPEVAARFWSSALGMPSAEAEHGYSELTADNRGLHIEVQNVDHPSRVHLDIESDDVEAEVARLEKLGAKKIKQVRTWWVMEAPTGHRFCVIRARSFDTAKGLNAWP